MISGMTRMWRVPLAAAALAAPLALFAAEPVDEPATLNDSPNLAEPQSTETGNPDVFDLNLLPQEPAFEARQPAQEASDRQQKLHGELMSLEQWMSAGSQESASGTDRQGAGPWVLKTDDGSMVILSGDAPQMWRGGDTQAQSGSRS